MPKEKKPVAPPAKPPKKASKKATKKATPKITEADYEKWFFGLSPDYFAQMQREWNERNLKVNLTPQPHYDAWLNYFKGLPPSTVRLLISTGEGAMSTEAYAALLRWADILGNPHRIDKIHQSGLTNPNGSRKSIVEMAHDNNVLGVLMGARDQLAEKLDKGAGARDTASLAREIADIMSQIAAYEKRQGPKKDTLLGQLTSDMPTMKKRTRNKGSRNVNFASRVKTIEDVEGKRG